MQTETHKGLNNPYGFLMQISWLKKLCLILGGLSYGRDAREKIRNPFIWRLFFAVLGLILKNI